jgi:hypothetical protein
MVEDARSVLILSEMEVEGKERWHGRDACYPGVRDPRFASDEEVAEWLG